MPNWDAIRKEYETSKITLAALAEKHGIKIGTLKSRKSREGWSRGSPKKDATKMEKVATTSKRMQPKKEPELIIDNDELTENQKRFCLYYIKYFNATKAYQKAYECDYFTANANGSRLLVNASVKNEIERLKAEQQQSLFLEGKDVLQKYIDIAFADITDFVEFGQKEIKALNELTGEEENININYVDFKNSSEVDGAIITEVKKGKDGVSIKLADKMKALDFLSKYTDLLSENDRKRLHDEKIKADIAKSKVEIEKLQKSDDDQQDKDVAAALRGLVDAVNSKAD